MPSHTKHADEKEMLKDLLDAIVEGQAALPLLKSVAATGRVPLLRKLLRVLAAVDGRACFSAALQAAVKAGQTPCVEELLKAGAERGIAAHIVADVGEDVINRGSTEGWERVTGATPIAMAAHQGDASSLALLLAATDPTTRAAQLLAANSKGETALMLTIHPDCTRLLLDVDAAAREAQVSATRTPSLWTPLMYAAYNGNYSTMRLLIDAKSPLDAVDWNGDTALTLAVAEGHTDCALELLSASAPASAAPDTRSQVVCSAVRAAAEAGRAEVLEAMLRSDSARGLGQDIVASVGKDGTATGVTPLMMAAKRGLHECVALLLSLHKSSLEAQVTAVDSLGHSALMLAADASTETTGCIRLLLENEATRHVQLSASSSTGHSALSMAVRKGCVDRVRVLLQLGPSRGVPHLYLAILSSFTHPSCLEELVAYSTSAELAYALLHAARHLQRHASNLTASEIASTRRCMEIMIAKGVDMSKVSTGSADDMALISDVMSDLAQRALVPGRATEAVVGLALAAARNRPTDDPVVITID